MFRRADFSEVGGSSNVLDAGAGGRQGRLRGKEEGQISGSQHELDCSELAVHAVLCTLSAFPLINDL
jgi:hypothetical protein